MDGMLATIVRQKTGVSRTRLSECVRKAREAYSDARSPERLAARECQYCFYLENRGVARSAAYQCDICNKLMTFENSPVNTVCPECADKLKLCVRCGGLQ